MFETIRTAFRTWRLRAAARRYLRGMDDRMLADLGAERETIDDFVMRQDVCHTPR